MIQVRLPDIEFEADSGISVLFGAAGSGKTMILDAVAGFYKPPGGRILLDDEILFDAVSGVNIPPHRRNCAYVARDWALFPHLTIHENLLFPLPGIARLERHRRVKEAIDRFNLGDYAARLPHQAAPGERLRATFARALIGDPKLLLVDEPAGGLDVPLRAEWNRVLRMVREETSLPVLVAARDLESCFELAGNMLLLDQGRLLQSGPPRQLLDRPASVEAARLLGIRNLFRAEIVALDPGRNTSRLRLQDFEVSGLYFPGRLRGDRVWVCIEPGQLRATPRNGSKPQPNQVAARLARACDTPRTVRLEFTGGLVAEIARHDFDARRDNEEWLVEFPPAALRVL